MNMRRNRWLLIGLGLVVLFFVGDMGYRKLYEEPVGDRERLKEQLIKRLQTAKREVAKSKRVGEQLEQLEQKSLPWDAEMARARYQDWLVQVAKDAKLTNTSVDSGDPVSTTVSGGKGKRPVEIFKRFNFSLRGRGDFGQVTKFLYDFYRGGHLHKVRSMSLNPIGQGQEIDLSLSIEALALPNADREAELTTLVSEQLAQTDVRDYQLIARRNFFGSGGTESAWKQIQLSAITSDVRGVGEAWFQVGAENQTQVLQLGQALTMPSFEVRVVSVDETTATVSLDGRLYRLAIGQNLAEAVPVTETAPPVTETAPPVAETAPPVAETAPPVTEAAPPVTEAAPPVTETAPPVTEAAPPVTEAAPPVTEAAPPVAETAPPVTEAAPPVAETAPPSPSSP